MALPASNRYKREREATPSRLSLSLSLTDGPGDPRTLIGAGGSRDGDKGRDGEDRGAGQGPGSGAGKPLWELLPVAVGRGEARTISTLSLSLTDRGRDPGDPGDPHQAHVAPPGRAASRGRGGEAWGDRRGRVAEELVEAVRTGDRPLNTLRVQELKVIVDALELEVPSRRPRKAELVDVVTSWVQEQDHQNGCRRARRWMGRPPGNGDSLGGKRGAGGGSPSSRRGMW